MVCTTGHLQEQGELTGALLITFRDGGCSMTGLIDEADWPRS